jgi:hypothetical protein
MLPITEDLTQLASVIGSSMETCHQIAHGLSPLAESRGGFIGALQDLTSMPTKGGTEVALSIVGGHLERSRELAANSVRRQGSSAFAVVFADDD